MKRSGPPPKPPFLRVLTSNRGKRSTRTAALAEPRSGARCPAWLSPEAKQEWRRLAPELERLGGLKLIDRAVFAAYCSAWADFVWACEEVAKSGRIVCVQNGAEYIAPAVKIRDAAMKLLLSLAGEFGLTPAARTRVFFAESLAPDDEDERFFAPRPIGLPPARPRQPRWRGARDTEQDPTKR